MPNTHINFCYLLYQYLSPPDYYCVIHARLTISPRLCSAMLLSITDVVTEERKRGQIVSLHPRNSSPWVTSDTLLASVTPTIITARRLL